MYYVLSLILSNVNLGIRNESTEKIKRYPVTYLSDIRIVFIKLWNEFEVECFRLHFGTNVEKSTFQLQIQRIVN